LDVAAVVPSPRLACHRRSVGSNLSRRGRRSFAESSIPRTLRESNSGHCDRRSFAASSMPKTSRGVQFWTPRSSFLRRVYHAKGDPWGPISDVVAVVPSLSLASRARCGSPILDIAIVFPSLHLACRKRRAGSNFGPRDRRSFAAFSMPKEIRGDQSRTSWPSFLR